MVNAEKVYLMTQAAIFEEHEKDGAIKIVTYRRRDYILYHMLLVMFAATVAFALLVGVILLVTIMAHEEFVLNVAELIAIGAGVLIAYVLMMIAYFIFSHKHFGEKHVKARQDVKSYLFLLRKLEEEEKERAERNTAS